ncbi:MAG: hypothetical protein KDA90_21965 [Planctomycetaceae bacterium]|nr:hypothetical protein [Planctomycetaceae bacterium]
MNSQEQLQLESERKFLKQQLESLPPTAVLTRSSAESRMKIVEAFLASQPRQPKPMKAVLTFRGRPVVGSHGMFAEFGSRAANAFTEAVVTVGAALLGPLAPTGPLPNREQCQLLITNTAIGSFGFEFEEHRLGQLPFSEETPVSRALEITRGLLESSAQGTDDELAECASGISPRSIEAVRGFVQALATNEAVCTLVFGKQRFGFQDVGEVRKSLDRLSQDNLHETETKLFGEFQGVLPKGRTFEFRVAEAEVVRGKIGVEIDNPEEINRHLHQPVEITVLETRVGMGKPRYQLLKLPTWR